MLVVGNRIHESSVGIRLVGGYAEVRHNSVTGSGVGILAGDYDYSPDDLPPKWTTISSNRVTGNGWGILLPDHTYWGVRVLNNIVQHNENGIIAFEEGSGSSTSAGNKIGGNDARFNNIQDCLEGTPFPGRPGETGADGLLNAWYGNRGPHNTVPAGICR